MGKIKNKLVTAAIAIAGGLSANSIIETASSKQEQPSTVSVPSPTKQVKHSSSKKNAKVTKRIPTKVYHNFSEIPSISDEEAEIYRRNEYTYVLNATAYQKDGKIQIKRVLTAEVPSLNILSPTYYRECETYTPNPKEDSKVTYDLNPSLISPSGSYKGPTQMNDDAVKNFMKYLLANPKTREYLIPLFQTADQSYLNIAVKNLEKLFFTAEGTPLPPEKCNNILADKAYTNLKIKGNVTQAYKKLATSMPKKIFLSELENYQLRYFGIGRLGKPQEIIEAVAKQLNYKTTTGEINATRVNMYIMGAAYCHVNWKGNGLTPLSDAKNKANPNTLATAKSWVNDKGTDGVIALSQQTIITPQIIAQYQQMGISGATELNKAYQNAVAREELKMRIAQQKRKFMSPLAQNKKTFQIKAEMLKKQRG